MAQSQETAKAVKKTSVRKVRAPGAEKTAAPKAEAPKKSNPHLAIIPDGTLEGSTTGLFSGDRNVEIEMIDKRDPGTLTGRNKRALYKLRKGYESRQFAGAYLDKGIMKVLVASGLVAATGGQTVTKDGKRYLTDGETPVVFKLTAAGLKYGAA